MPIIAAGTSGLFSVTPGVSNFAIPFQQQINQQPAAHSGIFGPGLQFWFGFQPNLDGFDDILMGPGFQGFFTQPTGTGIPGGGTIGTNGGVTPTTNVGGLLGGNGTGVDANTLLALLGQQQQQSLLGGSNINNLLAGLGGGTMNTGLTGLTGLSGGGLDINSMMAAQSNPFGNLGGLNSISGLGNIGQGQIVSFGGRSFMAL